jgi:hypothetical protein
MVSKLLQPANSPDTSAVWSCHNFKAKVDGAVGSTGCGFVAFYGNTAVNRTHLFPV